LFVIEDYCVLCEVGNDYSRINSFYEFRFHMKNQNWHKVCKANVLWHLNGIAFRQTVSATQLHYVSVIKVSKKGETAVRE